MKCCKCERQIQKDKVITFYTCSKPVREYHFCEICHIRLVNEGQLPALSKNKDVKNERKIYEMEVEL